MRRILDQNLGLLPAASRAFPKTRQWPQTSLHRLDLSEGFLLAPDVPRPPQAGRAHCGAEVGAQGQNCVSQMALSSVCMWVWGGSGWR